MSIATKCTCHMSSNGYCNSGVKECTQLVSENKYPIGGYAPLPADDAVQNWFEENIDKECSASSAIYKFRLWLETLNAADQKNQTVTDYEEVLKDHSRLVRELDIYINGDAAAEQASLCDLVAQIGNFGLPAVWNTGYKMPVRILIAALMRLKNAIGEYADKDDELNRSVHNRRINIVSETIETIERYSECLGDIPDEPKPAGAVWVKGEYDRLYDLLKADVNCRIVCYVDYNTRSKNPDGSPYILRDICSIWGENMEFGSRGIGYGSVRFIPGDYKENFIELCKQMNVEWLDESGTASNNDAIEFAEWCAFNYQRDFEPLDSSLPINEREYRQFWVDNDQTEYTTADLYKLWQQPKSK